MKNKKTGGKLQGGKGNRVLAHTQHPFTKGVFDKVKPGKKTSK